MKKNKIVILIILSSIVLVSAFLSIFNLSFSKYKRCVLLFENFNDEIVFEDRKILKGSDEEMVSRYVNMALLGPLNHEYKNLFADGTRLKTCFLREKKLYIDLTENAVFADNKTTDVYEAVKLLKDGVFNNFGFVSDVEIYVMGKSLYDKH